MPKTYPIQSSFAAGEISPKLYGRYDTPGYKQGLAVCENMIVDSRGPLIKRSGFEHRSSIDGIEARLFQFNYSRSQTYLVVLTNLLITMSSASGDTVGPEQVINPEFDSGLTAWAIATTGRGAVVDNGNGSITLNAGERDGVTDNALMSQLITVSDATVDQVITLRGDFNSPPATPLRLRVGSTGPNSFDILDQALADNTTLFQVQLTGPITEPVTVSVYAEGHNVGGPAGATTQSIIEELSFKEFIPAVTQFTEVTPYPDADLEAVQAVMDPNGKNMYFTHPNHPVQQLIFTPSPVAWAFQARVFVGAPTEWVAGNYPGTSAFFQGRHWFAATPLDPESIWASKSAVYDDLTVGVAADDAFKFTIAEHGKIEWLLAGKDLLVGSALREFILTSSAGVITPTDVQVEQQSAYGSAPIQTTLLGTEALFISSDNTKLHSQWYQWTEAGYLTRDITYANDHITREFIRHLNYQREPEQLIWMPLKDGNMVGCSYHRDGNDKPTYGWHRHKFRGLILDAVSMQQEEATALALAMLVTIDGVNRVHIMLGATTTEPEGSGASVGTGFGTVGQNTGSQTVRSGYDPHQVFLDDYIDLISDGVTTVITGLEYLEGEEVQPVVDGAVENLKTVTGGQITLDNPGTEIQIGIPYSGKVVTLPLVNEMQGGSSASWEKQRNKIFVRVLQSAKPLINGERPPERHPATPMNEVEPLDSADYQVTSLGLNHLVPVTIEQDLPKPLNISMIFGEVDQETL